MDLSSLICNSKDVIRDSLHGGKEWRESVSCHKISTHFEKKAKGGMVTDLPEWREQRKEMLT